MSILLEALKKAAKEKSADTPVPRDFEKQLVGEGAQLFENENALQDDSGLKNNKHDIHDKNRLTFQIKSENERETGEGAGAHHNVIPSFDLITSESDSAVSAADEGHVPRQATDAADGLKPGVEDDPFESIDMPEERADERSDASEEVDDPLYDPASVRLGTETDDGVLDGHSPQRDNADDVISEVVAQGDGPARKVSRKISQATAKELSTVSIAYYLKRVGLFALVPVLFVLVVFYSALQWYSHLSNDFQRKYNPSIFYGVFSRYNHIIKEGNEEASGTPAGSSSGRAADAGKETSVADHGAVVAESSTAGVNYQNLSQAIYAAYRRHPVSDSSVKRGASGTAQSKTYSKKPYERLRPHHLAQSYAHKTGSARTHDVKHTAHERPAVLIRESIDSRVKSLVEKGRLDEALALIDRALVKRRGDGRLNFYKGYILFKKGKIRQAVRVLDANLKRDPYDRRSAEVLANIYYKQGILKLSWLRHQHDNLPDSAILATMLASFYQNQGYPDSAADVLQETLRLNPNPDLAFNLAVIQENAGRYEEAYRSLTQAISLSHQKKPAFSEQDVASLLDRIEHGLSHDDK